MIPKQKTVAVIYFHAIIPKGLIGQDVPLPYVANLGLTVKVAKLPVGKGRVLVLHRCNFPLCE